MKNPGKPQRSLFQTAKLGAKIVIGLEVASFVGSYLVWRKMNRDIDFRLKLYKMSPMALNYFYKVGETLGGYSTRQDDYAAWGVSVTSNEK